MSGVHNLITGRPTRSRDGGSMATELPPFAHDRPLVGAAVEFASRCHLCQRRESDAAPFLLHPLEVAALLVGRAYPDDVVAAGVLHDVVEKTDATVEGIRARFGDRVAVLVAAVTEDGTVADYAARKAELRARVAQADDEALAIYAADKLAKTRELRALAAREHVSLAEPSLARRLAHYEQSLELLERATPGAPLVNQMRFELWALRQLPPGGARGTEV
jgi:(p)ppGpp synthase/HD superfamily hydrolase